MPSHRKIHDFSNLKDSNNVNEHNLEPTQTSNYADPKSDDTLPDSRTLPSVKGRKTLGNFFAECSTRRSAHDLSSTGEAGFAECLFSGTR